MTNTINVMNKTILITGANRGIGQALLREALRRGEEDIFPDSASAPIAEAWRNDPAKMPERQFAAFVPQLAA